MCKAQLTFVSLNREDSRFMVEVDILFIYESVCDDASLLFIPNLVGSSSCLELPSILVVGKRRYWAFKSAIWGMTNNILSSYKIHKVLKAVNSRVVSYHYRISLDYEDWMSSARVSLS